MIDSKSVCCEAVAKARAGEGGRGGLGDRDGEEGDGLVVDLGVGRALENLDHRSLSTAPCRQRAHQPAPMQNGCSTNAGLIFDAASKFCSHDVWKRLRSWSTGVLVSPLGRGEGLTNGQAVKDHAELPVSPPSLKPQNGAI